MLLHTARDSQRIRRRSVQLPNRDNALLSFTFMTFMPLIFLMFITARERLIIFFFFL